MRLRFVTAGFLLSTLSLQAGGAPVAMGQTAAEPNSLQSAVTTAFTYQGSLTAGDEPADGIFDFRFSLFDAESEGSPVGSPLELQDQIVEKGLFTVPLDFGAVFGGDALWLEIRVRSGESDDDYSLLNPRQALTAAPIALHAVNAWSLSGNAGSLPGQNFLGTTDPLPLVLKTNAVEAMRIDAAGHVGIGTQGPVARLDAYALSGGSIAVMGTSDARGVIGRLGVAPCPGLYGVGGCAGDTAGAGVVGRAGTGPGVQGVSDSGVGVEGGSTSNTGLRGSSVTGIGVHGSSGYRGVQGTSSLGIGVLGDSSVRGVVGTLGSSSCAGQFAVGGCSGGAQAAGVYGFSPSVVGVMSRSDSGSIFLGVSGPSETPQMRVNASGRGYFNGGTQVGGADYAESMPIADASEALEPGDVLEIDPERGLIVRRSRTPVSRLLVGVYSTRPSILAVGDHGIDDSLFGEVPVALLGVVPTKVSAENGPIAIGDLLVTASLPGHAMKAIPERLGEAAIYPTGAILGKALEPLLEGTGRIDVLVTLR